MDSEDFVELKETLDALETVADRLEAHTRTLGEKLESFLQSRRNVTTQDSEKILENDTSEQKVSNICNSDSTSLEEEPISLQALHAIIAQQAEVTSSQQTQAQVLSLDGIRTLLRQLAENQQQDSND